MNPFKQLPLPSRMMNARRIKKRSLGLHGKRKKKYREVFGK